MKYELADFIYESYLSSSNFNLCDLLIERYNNSMPIFSGERKEFGDPLIRTDNSVFCSEDFSILIHDALVEHMETYRKKVKYTHDLFLDSAKIQKTLPTEGYHTWHFERNPMDFACSCREMVYTIFLNTVEEGGETEFLHQSRRIKPEKGKVIIWPAQFTHIHRGNPPLSGEKYIVTGWLTNARFTVTA